MKNTSTETNEDLDRLYQQLKKSANDPETGWHEFSRHIQQFTRTLFRYKRRHDQQAAVDETPDAESKL